jgi:HD-GYP domain-containing protein (c-di-GMP phosphodiesterase class II)
LNTRNTSLLRPLKRTIVIVAITIIAILTLFIYIIYQTSHKEEEDKLIINAFGKQRMYTQLIAKDASGLYALIQSLESDKIYQTKENVNQKIIDVKASLISAKEDFANTLASIHKGYIFVDNHEINIEDSVKQDSDYLIQIDTLWSEFDEAINVIVNANSINSDTAAATIFVNENNMQLLKLCDSMLNQILANSIDSTRQMEQRAFGIIGILSIVLILALYNLFKYVLLPFNQLYKGITDIGLTHELQQTKLLTNNKMMPIVSEINEMFNKINDLISLIENINNNSSFMEILNFINTTFSSVIPYNYIGIALIDDEKKVLRASYGVTDGSIVGLPENIVGATWEIKDTSLGHLLHTGEARIINDLEEYTAGRPLKPYNSVILEAGIKASITLPLKVSGEPVGVIFFSSSRKNVYNEGHLNYLNTLVNSIAISFNQNIFINDILYSSVLALAKLAEARDEDTGEHLVRMKKYSRLITEILYDNKEYMDEITLEFIEMIERFSPLHDIGKVGIRDGILLKPGKLTPEEFEEMKKHTVYGAEVLRAAEDNMEKRGKSLFGMGLEIAEGHHEKWDGSGYPFGKKGLEIPLSARIVAVADVFDALTSRRPYKEAYSLEVSYGILAEGRGKHFDPVIIDIFMENKNKIEMQYYQLRLEQQPAKLLV